MSISNTILLKVADKLARFAGTVVGDPILTSGLNAGFAAGSDAVMSGSNSIATYLIAQADEGSLADLLPAARDLDETNPTPPTRFLITVPSIAAEIKALDTYCKHYGGAASFNAYMTAQNVAGPVVRVHQLFADHLQSMSPSNVFIGSDTVLAHINITGTAAGTYVHDVAIDKTKYSGAKLVAKNVGALTGTTALSITGKKFDGTSATLTVSIATLTDAHETDLSDTTKVFVDVTGITVTSGGTNTNRVNIVAKTDRDISAA
jgi:hypothetical protein